MFWNRSYVHQTGSTRGIIKLQYCSAFMHFYQPQNCIFIVLQKGKILTLLWLHKIVQNKILTMLCLYDGKITTFSQQLVFYMILVCVAVDPLDIFIWQHLFESYSALENPQQFSDILIKLSLAPAAGTQLWPGAVTEEARLPCSDWWLQWWEATVIITPSMGLICNI